MHRLVTWLVVIHAVFVTAAFAGAQEIKLYLKDGTSEKLYGENKSYALVIGVNKYRMLRELNYAVDDAQKVARELEAKGFEVITYVDPNMTGSQLRDAVEKFVLEYGFVEDSRVLIWFAGHGMTIDGEGYLLGVDAPAVDRDSPTLSEDLKSFYEAAMPLRSFGIHLRQMRSKHVLLVVDSCFAGTIFTNTRASASMQLRKEMARPARQIITAGLAGEEVADDGAFADMFIRAINGRPGPSGAIADQSNDGYLSGTELGNFLAVSTRGSGQNPQYGKLRRDVDSNTTNTRAPLFTTDQFDLEGGEFFFVLDSFQPPVEVAAADTSATRSGSVDAVTWRELADGTKIVNASPDPVPIYVSSPPAVGEKRFDLRAGEQYPAASKSAVFEQASIDDSTWLRFERDGKFYYVREKDIQVVRPN